jgi:hypothetical protein
MNKIKLDTEVSDLREFPCASGEELFESLLPGATVRQVKFMRRYPA